MIPLMPELVKCYDLGFNAFAEPLYNIIASGKTNGEKIALIADLMDRYYERTQGTRALSEAMPKLEAVRDLCVQEGVK